MKIIVVVFHLLAVLCLDNWLWKIWQSHRDVTHWFCKLLKLKDSIFGCVDCTRNGQWLEFFSPKARPPAVAIIVIICNAGSDKVLTPGDVQRSGSSPSHKTGWTNTRHDIPSETNHDMKHVINWFFCAVQNECLVIQVTPGDVFQYLTKVKRRAIRTRRLTLDILFVLPHKWITFTAAFVHIHFLYFFITIKTKLNGCGVLSNFRIDWKRRLLEVFKMTELDARIEIEAIQRPWRAIINTRADHYWSNCTCNFLIYTDQRATLFQTAMIYHQFGPLLQCVELHRLGRNSKDKSFFSFSHLRTLEPPSRREMDSLCACFTWKAEEGRVEGSRRQGMSLQLGVIMSCGAKRQCWLQNPFHYSPRTRTLSPL